MRPIVIIESPFAGDIERNIAFARACVRESIMRGEVPFASHLLYTQPGILRDGDPKERLIGMEVGWQMMRAANLVAVYINLGISSGMLAGMEHAATIGLTVEHRRLAGW